MMMHFVKIVLVVATAPSFSPPATALSFNPSAIFSSLIHYANRSTFDHIEKKKTWSAPSSGHIRCPQLPSFLNESMDKGWWWNRSTISFAMNDRVSKRLKDLLSNRSESEPFGHDQLARREAKLSTQEGDIRLALRNGVLVEPLGDSQGRAQPTDLDRFDRVLSYAASNATGGFTVLVLGGSMTAGRMAAWEAINSSECSVGVGYLSEDGKDFRGRRAQQCLQPPRNPTHADCKPCAFPARLEYWLKKSYPNRTVKVVNQAVGGEGTTSCLGRIGGALVAGNLSDKVDVVILNYVDNDAAKIGGLSETALKLANKHLPGLSSNFSASATASEKLMRRSEQELRSDLEALIRELLQLPRSPAVLSMQLSKHGDKPRGVYPLHDEVLSYYGIPTISWERSAGFLNIFPALERHPSWPWHQAVADWLAFTWTRLAQHAFTAAAAAASTSTLGTSSSQQQAHPPPAVGGGRDSRYAATIDLPPPKWKDIDSCTTPVTFLDSGSAPPNLDKAGNILPLTRGDRGPWAFGEDHPGNGKMAWWADAPLGGVLTFPVRTARHPPAIGVGYLSSWDPSMGSARFSLVGDPTGWSVVINASRSSMESKISVSDYQRLCVDVAGVGWVPQRNTSQPGIKAPPKKYPALPPCEESDIGKMKKNEAALHIHKILVQQETAMREADHLLRVELIPSPQKKRNKFAIRYITAC